MNVEEMLKKLTLEEKIALLAGTDFMYTNPIPAKNVPSIRMSDGPHGLRVQNAGGDNGVAGSEQATCFPTSATTANSFNPENARKVGEAIGEESNYFGINVVLGPGVNIKRNPLCGRNFEYFSEDPHLAAEMGIAEVKGIRSKNVGVSVKHFAFNNSENYRFMGNSVVDDKAAREIYLKAFERIVKESAPDTLMCAYNRVNGEFCSQNEWLLTDVLRNEWGFNGLVMTDWGAAKDRVQGVKSGLDLEMPGDTAICRKSLYDAAKSGDLSEEDLNKAVRNVLTLAERYGNVTKTDNVDWDAHDEIAVEVAVDSAVLLKNDGALPLDKKEKILVVGELFKSMRFQGSGSSMITPKKLTTPKIAFDKNGVAYDYALGYTEGKPTPDKTLTDEAVLKAKKCDKIVLFAGLTEIAESEGFDRETMCLPENQVELIKELVKTGKKIVVVLFGGAPVETPFAVGVNAILDMYLAGQGGGVATYKLLFGESNPSGRLAETWPLKYSDVPYGDGFGKDYTEVYKESVFVGYRYYTTFDKRVRFPFGYGLSYTSFEWSDMSITVDGDVIKATCSVKNTGERFGAEVVQLYSGLERSDTLRPIRELRAFRKVYLDAGESKTVEMSFPISDLAVRSGKRKSFVIEGGDYDISLCLDAQTVKFTQKVRVDGENLAGEYEQDVLKAYRNMGCAPVSDDIFERMSGLKVPAPHRKKPITIESRLSEYKSTLFGKRIIKGMLKVSSKQLKAAKKMPDGVEKDNMIKGAVFLERILLSNSARSLSMSAGANLPYNVAEGFVLVANGKLIRGMKKMKEPIIAPKLPKNE